MNLPYPLLSDWLYTLAWLLWLPAVGWALWRADWRFLTRDNHSHVWAATLVALALMWSLKAGVKPGLELHLTGAMLLTLLSGAPLAFLGLNVVLAAIFVNQGIAWPAFAINALMTAGIGVLIAQGIHRLVNHCFKPHFFITIFLKAFFGSGLAVFGIGLGFCLLYALTGIYSWTYLSGDYLPYYLLLGFSEAWLTGIVFTLLMVYYPGTIATFDDAIYSR
ncbi:MAG: energy-coupling factor ABC transporter permease [Zoogloeaceae bacterium]|jgi:uncharacterized membrane protein|nr:energy-coupling factor ABC transporter permease [Zoogloeaceae bacterium]